MILTTVLTIILAVIMLACVALIAYDKGRVHGCAEVRRHIRSLARERDNLLVKLASADLQNDHLKKLCYGVAEETGIPFKPGVLDNPPPTAWACKFCGYANTINEHFCGRCDHQAV